MNMCTILSLSAFIRLCSLIWSTINFPLYLTMESTLVGSAGKSNEGGVGIQKFSVPIDTEGKLSLHRLTLWEGRRSNTYDSGSKHAKCTSCVKELTKKPDLEDYEGPADHTLGRNSSFGRLTRSTWWEKQPSKQGDVKFRHRLGSGQIENNCGSILLKNPESPLSENNSVIRKMHPQSISSGLLNQNIFFRKKSEKKKAQKLIKEVVEAARSWSWFMEGQQSSFLDPQDIKFSIKTTLESMINLYFFYGCRSPNFEDIILETIMEKVAEDCMRFFPKYDAKIKLNRQNETSEELDTYYWAFLMLKFFILLRKHQIVPKYQILEFFKEHNLDNVLSEYFSEHFLPKSTDKVMNCNFNFKMAVRYSSSAEGLEGVLEFLNTKNLLKLESQYILNENRILQKYFPEDVKFNQLMKQFGEINYHHHYNKFLNGNLEVFFEEYTRYINSLSENFPKNKINYYGIESHKIAYNMLVLLIKYYFNHNLSINFQIFQDEIILNKINLLEETLGLYSMMIKSINLRVITINRVYFEGELYGSLKEKIQELEFHLSSSFEEEMEEDHLPNYYFFNQELLSSQRINSGEVEIFKNKIKLKEIFTGKSTENIENCIKKQVQLYSRYQKQKEILRELLGSKTKDNFIDSMDEILDFSTNIVIQMDNFFLTNHNSRNSLYSILSSVVFGLDLKFWKKIFYINFN